ncbi:hypothetical protein [Halocola ammonii]
MTRAAIYTSFIFLILGLIGWIVNQFVATEEVVGAAVNGLFVGFYLIQFGLLVRQSTYLKRIAFVLIAVAGFILAGVGGYYMSEFHPRGPVLFTIGQGLVALSYTLWIVLKKEKHPIDLLKYMWVVGFCLSVTDINYDLFPGPWLDFLWFAAFVGVAIFNSKKELEKVEK